MNKICKDMYDMYVYNFNCIFLYNKNVLANIIKKNSVYYID
jgi:hypothetical protein